MNQDQNKLYPIFLKASQLNILIVGGGNVALEKLNFLLKSSPDAKVKILSKDFDPRLIDLADRFDVPLIRSRFSRAVLKNKQIVIAATNNKPINRQIYQDAKAKNILVNVADTPNLCDFYLGGIVTKGHIKIAISTNGKSPTLAKRLREFFEEIIPQDINELAENLNKIRTKIKGNFASKVFKLNDLTKSILSK